MDNLNALFQWWIGQPGVPGLIGAGMACFVSLAILHLCWALYRTRGPDLRVRELAETTAKLPPAVVNLLVTRGQFQQDEAAAATLLDLASRGWYDLEQVTATTILLHPRPKAHPGKLRPYEAQLVTYVEGLVRDGTISTDALAGGQDDDNRLAAHFEEAVRTDAQRRKLTRGGAESAAIFTVMIAAGWVGLWLDAAVLPLVGGHPGGGLVIPAALAAAIAMASWMSRTPPERLTRAGRRAAGGWLGERERLRDIHGIDTLSPAAVTVWGKSLGYAAATGLAAQAVAHLPVFGDPDDHHAWSTHSGLWRHVRLRDPARSRRDFLADALRWGFPIATVGFALHYDLSVVGPNAVPKAFAFAFVLAAGFAFALFVWAPLSGILTTARTIRAWWAARHGGTGTPVEGELIRFVRDDRICHLAVDDGTAPAIRMLTAAPKIRGNARVGDTVRAWVTAGGYVSRLDITRVGARTPRTRRRRAGSRRRASS
ncbi:DUF2207 family protein [Fodinicola feengrottensis]|uniref:DUF2207 family protein n=1 Tax=Fodinicola feengrottensis TaxID=435914 RepID=UPI0031D66F1D